MIERGLATRVKGKLKVLHPQISLPYELVCSQLARFLATQLTKTVKHRLENLDGICNDFRDQVLELCVLVVPKQYDCPQNEQLMQCCFFVHREDDSEIMPPKGEIGELVIKDIALYVTLTHSRLPLTYKEKH